MPGKLRDRLQFLLAVAAARGMTRMVRDAVCVWLSSVATVSVRVCSPGSEIVRCPLAPSAINVPPSVQENFAELYQALGHSAENVN